MGIINVLYYLSMVSDPYKFLMIEKIFAIDTSSV